MAVSTRGKKSSATRSRAKSTRGGTTSKRAAAAPRAHKWVYRFDEGSASMRDLLGGKGAGVAEMTRAGLPVPARVHDHDRGLQRLLRARRASSPRASGSRSRTRSRGVEKTTGKGFGDPRNPLLVSVRSGAKFSMPGMMDTVLNLGLNAETVRRPRGAHEGPSASHSMRTAASSRCSARSCSASTGSSSSMRSTRSRSARRRKTDAELTAASARRS